MLPVINDHPEVDKPLRRSSDFVVANSLASDVRCSAQKQLTSFLSRQCGIGFVPAGKTLKFVRGRIEARKEFIKVLTSVTGNVRKFPVDLKRESARATQSGRVATWEKT